MDETHLNSLEKALALMLLSSGKNRQKLRHHVQNMLQLKKRCPDETHRRCPRAFASANLKDEHMPIPKN